MRRIQVTHRAAAVVVIAVIASAGIAACGGSLRPSSKAKNASAQSTTTTANGTAARAKLVACLKKHGVTLPNPRNFHRPGTGTGTGTTPSGGSRSGDGYSHGGYPGGGFGSGRGFSGGGQNSKFAKAFKACGGSFGGFGAGSRGFGSHPGPGAGRYSRAFSTKALDSFVACIRKNGYPAMPKPNSSGKAPVFPASVERNAKFRKASVKCDRILRRAYAPPSNSPPPERTTTTTSSA
ncbi:MAG: hypothetical protein ACRDKL_04085 [Solirubrobacteraceae bacterium]